jgi:trehalose 6-phosphate phosphatase
MASVAVKPEYTQFLNELSVASNRLLVLDYDGTLAPFTKDRIKARPYAGVRELLDQIIADCHTRVVFITGRRASDIPRLLRLRDSVEVWGVYGLERIHPDGTREMGFMPDVGVKAIAEAVASLEEIGLGDRIDKKIGAVAVHWRGLSQKQAEEIRSESYRKLASLACSANLTLCEFEGGIELRLPGCDKGHSMQTLLAEVDEDVPVAFLGDDMNDESAFRALDERGLSVLVRPAFRRTSAHIWLQPPHQLIEFLQNWVSACGGQQ